MKASSGIIRSNVFPVILAVAVLPFFGCDSGIPTSLSPQVVDRPDNFTRIQPDPDHPWYWMYRGEPILLIGGSDEDNLFNHPQLPPQGLEAHLDLLVSVGGNYVRNTMSSRGPGNLWPFRSIGNGRFDLDEWNDGYWGRLEDFLRMTRERGIIVQLELWDRFDFALEPWGENPFNPANNINYAAEEVGLPVSIATHPGQRENPFFRSTPGQEDNPVLLGYQEAFVEKLLSISLPYPHVLYTVSNETNESEVWSAYWADFLRENAAETGYTVHVTEMWDPWDLRDPMHDHTLGDPVRYTFVEISQNNHQVGDVHWERVQERRSSILSAPRPLTNVKVYGGTALGGGFEEGTRKFWRNVFGGGASARFHRPGRPPDAPPGSFGVGLNELAQSHLRSMRLLADEMNVFSAEPRNDLLNDREADEAYAMADVGREYAVYFTDGGAVSLDLTDVGGRMTLRWLDILRSEWSAPVPVDGGRVLELSTPGPGPWAVVLTVDQGT